MKPKVAANDRPNQIFPILSRVLSIGMTLLGNHCPASTWKENARLSRHWAVYWLSSPQSLSWSMQHQRHSIFSQLTAKRSQCIMKNRTRPWRTNSTWMIAISGLLFRLRRRMAENWKMILATCGGSSESKGSRIMSLLNAYCLSTNAQMKTMISFTR